MKRDRVIVPVEEEGEPLPCYFNTGCGTYTDGLTALEIAPGRPLDARRQAAAVNSWRDRRVGSAPCGHTRRRRTPGTAGAPSLRSNEALKPKLPNTRQVLQHAHPGTSPGSVYPTAAAERTGTCGTRNRTHPRLALISSQCLMRHVTQYLGLPASSPLQPPHRFFSLRWPIQRPQFIPQGAIIVASSDSGKTAFPVLMPASVPSRQASGVRRQTPVS